MTAKPEPTGEVVGNVMFSRGGVNVNVWLSGNEGEDVLRLVSVYSSIDGFLGGLAPAERDELLREKSRGGGGFGGRGGGRADRFPVIEGYECDKCHGPVGRKAKTGGMRTDAVVCLGSCQDPGKDGGRPFTHTVGWCNDDGTPGPQVPKSQGGLAQRESSGREPQAPGSTPGSPTPSQKTVGDLLNWALKEHGLDSRKVCEIVGVSGAADITDIPGATKQVIAHVNGVPVA